MEKIDIAKRYIANEEVRLDKLPYQSYYHVLNEVFEFDKLNSFCDVGCATGHLQYFIKENHENVNVLGLDFFQYHKDAAEEKIKETILVCDLRDELKINSQYDLVNCTEVGEHIDKNYASIFLNNIKNITKNYLVMSWSDTGGENNAENDPHHQHLNPLSYTEFVSLMTSMGFCLNKQKTFELNEKSHRPHFHDWWRKSLSVWTLQP